MKLWVVGILPICSRFSSWFNSEFARAIKLLGVDGELVSPVNGCVGEMTNYFTNEPAYIDYELLAAKRVLDSAREGDRVLWLDFDYPGFSVPSAFLLKKRGVLSYGIFHGAFFNEGDVWNMLPERRWFMKAGVGVAERVFVASEWFRRRLIDELDASGDKIVVTGLPFDPSSFRLDLRAKANRDVLVVIGDDIPPVPGFRKVVARGFSRGEYLRLLSEAKFAVVNKKAETFGYAVLEALASGVVVIAPNKFSYPEFKHPSKPDLLILANDPARDAPSIISEFGWRPEEIEERWRNTVEFLSKYKDAAVEIVRHVISRKS
jgi:hypothetical protein